MSYIDEIINENKNNEKNPTDSNGDLQHITYVSGMYQNWFLDYASYVILERAVPFLYDGLKPVQRRILHSMKKLDDGRFNKVANIIGHTMQFHPHGDASIGDALVQLGQKNLLIETQGNWGNIFTGDAAAAARYIEARLSKFSLEVVFNPKTTEWKTTYDGRNNEPIFLPVKFPLLLAQGSEGIAVGLASKILPHNFLELIDSCIKHLKGEDFELYPDFPTGGLADFSKYNDGLRGGKVRIRAKISKLDKKALIITEIPFGTTTNTLIDSILQANEKGKIKIRKIDDNTAANVEIVVHLVPGISSDMTIDALYALTACEVSVSPNSCVIDGDKPNFMGVKEILRRSADNTVMLLRLELEIRKKELEDDWHLSSLEKIFIENRIYNDIEECETWEAVIEAIDTGLDPFKHLLQREITQEDIAKLTEIKIKRISKYDGFKADEHLRHIEEEIKKIKHNLTHIIPYSIKYFENIRDKYGKGKERKTEIRGFDVIEATKVVIANEKLYVNRKEGFFGTSLKKDEYICDCSDIDDVIVFLRDGKYVISKISDKSFSGANILHIDIFRKNDERTVYNVVYLDGKTGFTMIKRFAVTGITRDKVYDITQGNPNSRILYFSANPNGEAETLRIMLKPKPKLKKPVFEFDMGEMVIKNRNAMGNILTKHSVHKIVMKEKGVSTLGGRNIWFDPEILRLNIDQRGILLGEFHEDDRIVAFYKSGVAQLYTYDLTNHFENDIILIEKYDPNRIYSVAYFDAEQNLHYLKRFQMEFTEKEINVIDEHPESKIMTILTDKYPRVEITFGGKYSKRPAEILDVSTHIGVKSYKAKGKRISNYMVENITRLEPIVTEQEIERFKETHEIEFEITNTMTGENVEQTSLFN